MSLFLLIYGLVLCDFTIEHFIHVQDLFVHSNIGCGLFGNHLLRPILRCIRVSTEKFSNVLPLFSQRSQMLTQSRICNGQSIDRF